MIKWADNVQKPRLVPEPASVFCLTNPIQVEVRVVISHRANNALEVG